MEIDRAKLREFILWLWSVVEKHERDLLAYKVVFSLLTVTQSTQSLDDLLKQAKENPSPALALQHKQVRETLDKLLNQSDVEAALAKFLREWKPSGPIQ